MWKQLWQKWTIDKPAAFGDWLWQTFVVDLAALLDRVTLRQVIALIPVVILVLAYAHRIPLPPELMLVGDILAYIDVFSMMLLLGLLARISVMLYVVRRAVQFARNLASRGLHWRRPDARHRRVSGTKRRAGKGIKAKDDDAWAPGLAWA